jgi:putative glutamine amidotransferase
VHPFSSLFVSPATGDDMEVFMKPLIGITMTPDTRDGDRLGRIYSFYLDAVRAAGGIPVMLFDGAGEAGELAWRLDGLLLSGGADVNPSMFGEENTHSESVDDLRDAMETACITAFCEKGKPVLGICRGMQIMAAALGGTLWQDISEQTGAEHPAGKNHEIIVRGGTFLSPVLPERAAVNSTHHQAVRTLPPRFMVSAVSPDGVIEAMEASDGRRLYAVQFHPERLFQADARMLGIFKILAF